jgi:hypothetical protein
MAITIDETVGGANANSFVTHAEFEAYMDGRLNADAFNAATFLERTQALVEATRDLSARPWQGRRVTATQALSWPRQWAHDPDSPTQDYFATTVIPIRIKRATYELALAFLKAGDVDVASLDETVKVARKRVDVLETEYLHPDIPQRGLSRFPAVLREIRPLMGGYDMTTRVVRG